MPLLMSRFELTPRMVGLIGQALVWGWRSAPRLAARLRTA
jgi:hypothetical protein